MPKAKGVDWRGCRCVTGNEDERLKVSIEVCFAATRSQLHGILSSSGNCLEGAVANLTGDAKAANEPFGYEKELV